MATARRSRIVEGSCWTCRRKRVKCDLLEPTCRRCSDASQQCYYGAQAPFKWVGGMAMRGRNAPAHAPETFENHSTALLAPPTAGPLDAERLVLYFTNAVLPRFQLMEETLPLDINVVMKDEALQQAVLAVSQAHHNLFSHATSNKSALCRRQTRHTAIQSLRQQLERGVESASSAQQVFTITVLLCMLEGMIEPSEQLNASMLHLKGGYAMLNSWSNTPANMLMEGGLKAHLLSVFSTMDLVHALLSGDKPFFDPLIWHMFSDIQAWWGRLPSGDRFLAILKLFSEMASLGHLVISHLPSDDGARLVEKCLPTIESNLSNQSFDAIKLHEDSPVLVGHWDTFCALYELSGLIYLNRALRNRPIHDESVQSATRKGVEKLLDEALPGMMAHCVILPILIIGAHCVHSQDRKAIERALSPSISYLSFGNLQMMISLLREIWNKSDVQATWWESFHSVSDKVFLF